MVEYKREVTKMKLIERKQYLIYTRGDERECCYE